ncbi:MAG: anthranilate synthase component I family protein [Opitutaceae bacterium]|nr:anthranilate synthase component I family protein [Opitutaceae bacterium]
MHTSLTHTRVATGAVRWLITPSQWREWRGSYHRLPMIAAFDGEALPEQWTALWHPRAVSVLLETGKQGRYTILGNGLRTRLSGDADGAVVWQRQESDAGDRVMERIPGPPLALLQNWLTRRQTPPVADAPPFYGGLVGYLAYDAGETLEALCLPDRPALAYPWYVWAEVEEGWVFDHKTGTLFCFSLCPANDVGGDRRALEAAFARAQEKVQGLHEQWNRWRAQPVPPPPPERLSVLPPDYFTVPDMQLSLNREAFIVAVRAAQERIAAGETYQVNLSIRQSRPLPAPPERIYEALRRLNPSPYMALLRFPEVTVVSGSPELLLSVAEGRLEAHPIAATRPRGPTPEADAALAAELASNAKECAEHLMLVDLLRNDIGRVAAFGTVRVVDFMAVERYSHVMHLVSRIEGGLAAGRTACDAVTALFPGGTITGAPKVRTMEVIGELEPLRRGIYTGAIGWLGYNANAKLNIAIRTLVAVDGMAQMQSGAGIVADSEPALEFEESLNKARALWLAAERAAEGGACG